MYHVEFLGPSGAGKTTIRRAVGEQLPDAVHGINGRNECLAASVPFEWPISGLEIPFVRWVFDSYWRARGREQQFNRALVEYPELGDGLTTVLQTVRTEDGLAAHVDPYSLNEHLLEEIATYRLFASSSLEEIPVLIDDGLYQFFLFQLLGESTWSLDRLVDTLPRPDLIVVVEAPLQTCYRRQEMRSRGRIGPMTGLDRDEVRRFIDEMGVAANELADEASQYGTQSIQITNNGEIESAVTTIIDQIAADRRSD